MRLPHSKKDEERIGPARHNREMLEIRMRWNDDVQPLQTKMTSKRKIQLRTEKTARDMVIEKMFKPNVPIAPERLGQEIMKMRAAWKRAERDRDRLEEAYAIASCELIERLIDLHGALKGRKVVGHRRDESALFGEIVGSDQVGVTVRQDGAKGDIQIPWENLMSGQCRVELKS